MHCFMKAFSIEVRMTVYLKIFHKTEEETILLEDAVVISLHKYTKSVCDGQKY